MVTDEEIARAWLCFRELEHRMPMVLNPAPTTYAVMSKYSNAPWWRKEDLRIFIESNPHNVWLMYETGMDFMKHGTAHCVVLRRLPEYLLEVRGQVPPHARDTEYSPHLDSLFPSELELNALHLLHETKRIRALETATRLTHYNTRPFLLADPLGFIFNKYTITTYEVQSYRSVFGFKWGDRPVVRIENITRVYASGTLIGTITFGEGSVEPVVWKAVYRPEKKLREVKRIIASLVISDGNVVDSDSH